MADYVYEEDGKIHTRYSELKRCTPGGAEAVILERLGLKERYTGEAMGFGSERHLMWEEESKKTKLIPDCFEYELKKHGIPLDTELTGVEEELKFEIFPGVVLHGTPDAYSLPALLVTDNKTITGRADQFKTSDQLQVYVYLIYKIHKVLIKRGIYLCEIWSKDHQRILGYDSYLKEFNLGSLGQAEKWLQDRAEVLVTAIDVIKERTSEL